MLGFAPADGRVVVGPQLAAGIWNLDLLTLPQLLANSHVHILAAAKPPQLLIASEVGEAAQTSTQAPAMSLNVPQPSGGFLINGSVDNAATSQYTTSAAFGNHRPDIKNLYTGSIGARLDNSTFDARPYSLTGLAVPKADYTLVTSVVTLGGPLNIPPVMYHGPTFFVSYQWTRNRQAATQSGLVPDAAERGGDLSGLLNALGQPVTIYDPATGQPINGPVPVSPQAKALLALYPLPNVPGDTRYNYETQVLDSTHIDALQSRLDESLGRRDQFYGGLAFESTRSDTANLFHFRDTTDTFGLDAHINWSHQFNRNILLHLGYQFTRLRTRISPQFESNQNISGNAGITGNDQDPSDWGPPQLTFASGIEPLTDANSEFSRNRTDALSGSVSWSRGTHTVDAGGDFRRQEFNQLGQQDPRGEFIFTGAATQAPGSSGTFTGATPASGSDLADFLLGIPDTSALAFGNADKYFRQSVYDAYIADDWRVLSGLSINVGLRWDYGAPMTELFGRLVNLDIAPGFAAVAPVLGSDPHGALTGAAYPNSLIRPDKRGFEPRVGISWRPLAASTLVVRAGYGIYDDTSVYLSAVEAMAQQAPLSKSLTVSDSPTCPLTLADGFLDCAGTTSDTFAVDPNLRVGYAQTWQLALQKDLPGSLVIEAAYNSVKGTRGLQQFLPNTYPLGGSSPCSGCPLGFVYQVSGGDSTRQAGELELRRRLHDGISAKLQYTWSKSLDDDAVLGGQGHVEAQSQSEDQSQSVSPAPAAATPTIAQNWLDLQAERGLSVFDQRNLIKAEADYTSGTGIGGGALLNGWRGTVLKQWTVSTQITAGSGLPETPTYLAAVPGTGFVGTIRPNITGASIRQSLGGVFLNAAAYAAPTQGRWGSARRDSVPGPHQFSLDGSLSRSFHLRSPFDLDFVVNAINFLNHVDYTTWNTTINSSTFGLPIAANPMRSLQLSARLRF